jgi:hypothetical protein
MPDMWCYTITSHLPYTISFLVAFLHDPPLSRLRFFTDFSLLKSASQMLMLQLHNFDFTPNRNYLYTYCHFYYFFCCYIHTSKSNGIEDGDGAFVPEYLNTHLGLVYELGACFVKSKRRAMVRVLESSFGEESLRLSLLLAFTPGPVEFISTFPSTSSRGRAENWVLHLGSLEECVG